ncbi:pyruvate, phosphate dikinase [Microaerobacter geothermalis]|uniref:pyruvate, phosphate dikinase n=1 Tax=Microaerobacter geothermalis TaxID=674972 RepID=UPI001F250DB6|nr:pyruvate, phosphate dikinase [Microaerobacter geothermalis]MCF6093943.1 pyruvate, phosphate dikinase [Microaerobacter geothermalis]
MNRKYVYLFSEGNASMNHLLGRKGANLAEMFSLGLPVPPGFTITTDACRRYYKEGKKIHPKVEKQIDDALIYLEKVTGKEFSHPKNPLLVSVRSGSSVSMPGMMDTILNLGLNDKTVQGLAEQTENPRFALDSYRRFIQMFSDVVLGIDLYLFEQELDQLKEKEKIKRDSELTADHLTDLIRQYKKIVRQEVKDEFPQDPKVQLILAIGAVFDSWNNQRSMIYRKIHNLPDDLGTAVTVQMMVFGNLGDSSGTGVAFSRNPLSGENQLFGEYLVNAQGEDVVAGTRTPESLCILKESSPKAYDKLTEVAKTLENHYRDVQDIEFTIENGRLFLLQTRVAKRSAVAGIKFAVDMVNEGLISKKEALMRIDPSNLSTLLHQTIDPEVKADVLATGLPASPGAATGIIIFDPEEAERMLWTGQDVILVRSETSADDIHGMVASVGILTSRGGMTSHAAVVARDLGKPCIVGCDEITINLSQKELYIQGKTLREGDLITICGSSGKVFLGSVPLVPPQLTPECHTLLSWANEVKKLAVLGSVNTPEEAKTAKLFGAEGVGLCRTEHMFMDPARVPIVREMILAQNKWERKKALDKLIPMQKKDFLGIFQAMEGCTVTIRLIDPPLHEFLPNAETLTMEIERAKMAKNYQEMEEKEELLKKVKGLHELNPAFGHRGCRIGITYPEIYDMQTRAIAEAALELKKEGIIVYPEIIVPLVSHINELKTVREQVEEVLSHVFLEYGDRIDIPIGTFIELPRACMTSHQIVEYSDFYTFGGNDLTQATFGFSRDDAEGKYLAYYLDYKILPENPFVVLDQEGVGELIRTAIEKGRARKPQLKIGACGEHSSEKKSVLFFQNIGVNFISCRPYRIPIARLAAAQAALAAAEKD